MKVIARTVFGLSLALYLASASFGADEQGAAKGAKKKKAPQTPAVFKLPDAVALTAEQQTKLDELKTQYTDKLREAAKKVNDVYTAEQQAAVQAARKAAVAEGKKGKQLKAAVDAAVQLSAEQQEKLTGAQKELGALQKEVRQKIIGLLTDEQKEHVKVKAKGKKAA